MAEATCEAHHQARGVLGETMRQCTTFSSQYFGNALNLTGLAAGILHPLARDKEMDVMADLQSSRDGVQGGGLDFTLLVFGNHKYSHSLSPQITFASFLSFSISSATLDTRTPAFRCAGSTTDRVLIRGARSLAKRDASTVSKGFFFAFMMLGRLA
ncbi:hypothetical protein D9M70_437550 [compost metagenome]